MHMKISYSLEAGLPSMGKKVNAEAPLTMIAVAVIVLFAVAAGAVWFFYGSDSDAGKNSSADQGMVGRVTESGDGQDTVNTQQQMLTSDSEVSRSEGGDTTGSERAGTLPALQTQNQSAPRSSDSSSGSAPSGSTTGVGAPSGQISSGGSASVSGSGQPAVDEAGAPRDTDGSQGAETSPSPEQGTSQSESDTTTSQPSSESPAETQTSATSSESESEPDDFCFNEAGEIILLQHTNDCN